MIPEGHDAPLPDPAASFDGGDLDCGNGLLLLIRKHINPLPTGSLLELFSRERSVREDLPAWCRLTGNQLVLVETDPASDRYLVCKGAFSPPGHPTDSTDVPGNLPLGNPTDHVPPTTPTPGTTHSQRTPATSPGPEQVAERRRAMPLTQAVVEIAIPTQLPQPVPGKLLPPLPVTGIGSWPRPKWLMRALNERLQDKISPDEFQEIADDAVDLVLNHQQSAGVHILTDGEQRRDNYSSFVGGLLDNCQLIPLTDLLPYVEDPERFARELQALDIPASEVMHPAVFGPLGRTQSLAVHEYSFVAKRSTLPVKVALPGPYLLTRTMWMECISDRAYDSRESLALDVVRVLREELHALLHAGATLVQFDEPVLTEVAFAQPAGQRTFMCGALGHRLPARDELNFALDLFQRLTDGVPLERVAIHICRGNWTADPTKALSGGYDSLLEFLHRVPVGNYFLEACTPRAGEWQVLAELPAHRRIGLGMVDQKCQSVEAPDQVAAQVERALRCFGQDRLMLTPDCGFATFADNPIASTEVARAKLSALTDARAMVLGHRRHPR